jgi:hypothetical protein
MLFYTEKCSILRFYRKKSLILSEYTLKGHKLASEQATKYLGVELSRDRFWKRHIDKIVNKDNRNFGFLRRNLQINNEVKGAAYCTLVQPGVEYCSVVWNPHDKDLR